MKFILGLLVLFFTLFAQSDERAFSVPTLQGAVADEAGFMDQASADALSRALISIYEKGGPQVGVVTLPSIGDMPIEDAAIKVAREWKLGTAEKDNGVVLLLAKKERQIRIEVGGGVEGDLTDAYSKRIIDNDMVPLLRQGETAGAIFAGVDGILRRMNPPIHLSDYMEAPQYREARGSRKGSWVHLLMFIVIIFLFSIGGGGRRGRRGSAANFATGMILGSMMGGGRSGGFGGGGGWSGGGGGFSGGGASGSW